MSAKIVGQVWELDLPHAEAWVLMALADHADHDGGSIYPGQPLIAWKTGYDERQVRRILHSLESRGIIVPVNQGGVGRGVKQEYRLDLSKAKRKEPLNPERRTKCPGSNNGKGGQNVRQVGQRKMDKMSGQTTQIAGQNVPPATGNKADISDTLGGHFSHFRRTFSTDKADISDTQNGTFANGNESLAGLTMYNHVEPSIETCSSSPPAENSKVNHDLDKIEALEQIITSTYQLKVIQGNLYTSLIKDVAALNVDETSLAELKEFFEACDRLPSIGFIAPELHRWRVNKQRAIERGKSKGQVHSSGQQTQVINCRRCRDRGFYGTPNGAKACECAKGVAYAQGR